MWLRTRCLACFSVDSLSCMVEAPRVPVARGDGVVSYGTRNKDLEFVACFRFVLFNINSVFT